MIIQLYNYDKHGYDDYEFEHPELYTPNKFNMVVNNLYHEMLKEFNFDPAINEFAEIYLSAENFLINYSSWPYIMKRRLDKTEMSFEEMVTRITCAERSFTDDGEVKILSINVGITESVKAFLSVQDVLYGNKTDIDHTEW